MLKFANFIIVQNLYEIVTKLNYDQLATHFETFYMKIVNVVTIATEIPYLPTHSNFDACAFQSQ